VGGPSGFGGELGRRSESEKAESSFSSWRRVGIGSSRPFEHEFRNRKVKKSLISLLFFSSPFLPVALPLSVDCSVVDMSKETWSETKRASKNKVLSINPSS